MVFYPLPLMFQVFAASPNTLHDTQLYTILCENSQRLPKTVNYRAWPIFVLCETAFNCQRFFINPTGVEMITSPCWSDVRTLCQTA